MSIIVLTVCFEIISLKLYEQCGEFKSYFLFTPTLKNGSLNGNEPNREKKPKDSPARSSAPFIVDKQGL
jgi:hypothetical protein